ncbi:MAG TPA: hypothetical protein VGP26_22070 [Actinophytocola sp.]|jgi:hypothetical protein|nr:hypothetical protein [Actinophytocola sp.]
MLVQRAILAGHGGDRAGMAAARAELAALGTDHCHHSARLHGLAGAVCSLLEEDRERARTDLAAALVADQAAPTTFALTGRLGLGLPLRALDGDLTTAEYAETAASPAAGLRWDRHFARLAAAVLAGADGDAAASQEAGAPYPIARHLGPRLVGEAAARNRWGAPETWLRTAEQYFHTAEISTVAGACRAQLRQMGVRVAQRRTGAHEVPDQLRLAGVTVREHEVLKLLGARLTNRLALIKLATEDL